MEFLECDCDNIFSTGNCSEGTGKCECRKEYTSPDCDSCSFGYFGYPNCRPCECFLNGTVDLQCAAENGKCTCRSNFGGEFCKECAPGFHNFPECKRKFSKCRLLFFLFYFFYSQLASAILKDQCLQFVKWVQETAHARITLLVKTVIDARMDIITFLPVHVSDTYSLVILQSSLSNNRKHNGNLMILDENKGFYY